MKDLREVLIEMKQSFTANPRQTLVDTIVTSVILGLSYLLILLGSICS